MPLSTILSPPSSETPGSLLMAVAALASGNSRIFSAETTFLIVRELICSFIALF